MYLKSQTFNLLHTNLPQLRRVVVRRGDEGIAGNGPEGVPDGIIEKRSKRPQRYISLANVAGKAWTLTSTSSGIDNSGSNGNCGTRRKYDTYLQLYYHNDGVCH